MNVTQYDDDLSKLFNIKLKKIYQKNLVKN